MNKITFGWARISDWGNHFWMRTFRGIFGYESSSNFQIISCFSLLNTPNNTASFSGGISDDWIKDPRENRITPCFESSRKAFKCFGNGFGGFICAPPTFIMPGIWGLGFDVDRCVFVRIREISLYNSCTEGSGFPSSAWKFCVDLDQLFYLQRS